MLRKWTFVVALVMIAIMLFSMTALAQTETGAGPDNPLPPDGAWTRLPEGGELWYAFFEEGDQEMVNISMQMVPNGAVAFELLTEEEIRAWANEEAYDPVGMGTRSCGCEPEDELGKSNWYGSFTRAGDFYVLVKNQNDDTSYYTLDVIGKEVSLPLAVAMKPAAETAVAAAPAATTMMEAPAPLAENAGESPFFAMPISQEWTDLSIGDQDWYAFTYDFDTGNAPLEIRAYANPPGSIVATVRNEDQARLWAQDGTETHFGCCQPFNIDNKVFDDEGDDFDKDKAYGDKTVEASYMRWVADELASGQYYIVVSPAKGLTEDISYRLEVLGDGLFSEQMVVEPTVEAVAALPAVDPVALNASAGESPALAMAITEDWMSVDEGQVQWYEFSYDSDSIYDPLQINVFSEPGASPVVTVRNEHQARLWAQEGKHEHFGCCQNFNIDNKVFDDEGDDFDKDKAYGDQTVEAPHMRWVASDLASGHYYIVVSLAAGEQGPARYRLEVLGQGVGS